MLRAARNRSMPLVPPKQEEGGSTASVVQCVTGLGKGQTRASPRSLVFHADPSRKLGNREEEPVLPWAQESARTPSSRPMCFLVKELGRLFSLGPAGEARNREEALYSTSSGERSASPLSCSTSLALLSASVLGFRDSGGGQSEKMAALDGFSTLGVPWTLATRHDSFELVQTAPVPASARRPILVRQFERNLALSNGLFSLSMW